MAKKKICVNCGRSIDEVARVCLYCNWLQSDPVPPRQPVATAPEYVPPPDTRARNKLIGIIGFAMLLLVAFIIGAFLHGSDRAKAAQPTPKVTKNTTEAEPRTTVTLVPITEGAPPPTLEPPVPSIASNGMQTSPGLNDTTALPADQYAAA